MAAPLPPSSISCATASRRAGCRSTATGAPTSASSAAAYRPLRGAAPGRTGRERRARRGGPHRLRRVGAQRRPAPPRPAPGHTLACRALRARARRCPVADRLRRGRVRARLRSPGYGIDCGLTDGLIEAFHRPRLEADAARFPGGARRGRRGGRLAACSTATGPQSRSARRPFTARCATKRAATSIPTAFRSARRARPSAPAPHSTRRRRQGASCRARPRVEAAHGRVKARHVSSPRTAPSRWTGSPCRAFPCRSSASSWRPSRWGAPADAHPARRRMRRRHALRGLLLAQDRRRPARLRRRRGGRRPPAGRHRRPRAAAPRPRLSAARRLGRRPCLGRHRAGHGEPPAVRAGSGAGHLGGGRLFGPGAGAGAHGGQAHRRQAPGREPRSTSSPASRTGLPDHPALQARSSGSASPGAVSRMPSESLSGRPRATVAMRYETMPGGSRRAEGPAPRAAPMRPVYPRG